MIPCRPFFCAKITKGACFVFASPETIPYEFYCMSLSLEPEKRVLNGGIMFSKEDLAIMKNNTSKYIILQMNYHDVTNHSSRTGHDSVIISNYSRPNCYLLHRHSGNYPYHRQHGRYKSLKDAIDYIDCHEEWFADRP